MLKRYSTVACFVTYAVLKFNSSWQEQGSVHIGSKSGSTNNKLRCRFLHRVFQSFDPCCACPVQEICRRPRCGFVGVQWTTERLRCGLVAACCMCSEESVEKQQPE